MVLCKVFSVLILNLKIRLQKSINPSLKLLTSFWLHSQLGVYNKGYRPNLFGSYWFKFVWCNIKFSILLSCKLILSQKGTQRKTHKSSRYITFIYDVVLRVFASCRIADRCQRFGKTYCLHLQGWSGDSMFFRNVGFCLRVYTAPKRRTPLRPPRKPRISQLSFEPASATRKAVTFLPTINKAVQNKK